MNEAQLKFVRQLMDEYKGRELNLLARTEEAERLAKQAQLEAVSLKQQLNLVTRTGKSQYKVRIKLDASKLVFYTGATRTKEYRCILDSAGTSNIILQITFENLIPQPLTQPFSVEAIYYFACSIYGNKKLKQGEQFENHTVIPHIHQLINYIWVNLTPNVCSVNNLKLCQEFKTRKCVTGEQEDYLEIVITVL